MSEPTPIDPGATGMHSAATEASPVEGERAATADGGDWHVRRAGPQDVGGIAAAVRELLFELGGKPAPSQELQAAARALIEDESAGALFVADCAGKVVGFLGVSWQQAVRIPGRYGLIQELWVHPAWRSQAIGAELLRALADTARADGVLRIEVGLPSERFPGVEATKAFYEANGFTPIGLRMRFLVA
jgi:branched-chain amino acid aminotransferase